MGWNDWMGKGHYVTTPGDPDPFFRPRRYDRSREEVAAAAREVLASLGDWRLEEYRENQGLLKLSRSVLFPPSAQDIHLYITAGPEGGAALEMTSFSRGGKRDWGRNKRNLRDFLGRMDAKIQPKA